MPKPIIWLFLAAVLVALGFLGARIVHRRQSGRAMLEAADADARSRLTALVHGNVKKVVEGPPTGPPERERVVLEEIHQALSRLGHFAGLGLIHAEVAKAERPGYAGLRLEYRLYYPHTRCVAVVDYVEKRGMSPLFAGIHVTGPCVRGLAEAEAHGLVP